VANDEHPTLFPLLRFLTAGFPGGGLELGLTRIPQVAGFAVSEPPPGRSLRSGHISRSTLEIETRARGFITHRAACEL